MRSELKKSRSACEAAAGLRGRLIGAGGAAASDEELLLIRDRLARVEKIECAYQVWMLDGDDRVIALIDKTLQISNRNHARAD